MVRRARPRYRRRVRIAYFGLPLGALLLLRDGHAIELCCISRADGVGLRRLRRLLGEARVLLQPDAHAPEVLERVRALQPDLLVSWFWTKRLPMALVAAARLGGFGVHPSLLPRHRGPDPTYWAIASGDRETGVTAHRIAAEYDTGEVLAQRRLTIDPAWNAWELARALDRPSLQLLRETAGRFAAGPVAGTRQDEAQATTAPFPDDDAAWIEWSWPTERILRHVRALAPAPGAVTEIAGRVVTVLAARAAAAFPAALEQGEGALVDGRVLVRCADGAVELLQTLVEPRDPGDEGDDGEQAGDGPEAEGGEGGDEPEGDDADADGASPETLAALFLSR